MAAPGLKLHNVAYERTRHTYEMTVTESAGRGRVRNVSLLVYDQNGDGVLDKYNDNIYIDESLGSDTFEIYRTKAQEAISLFRKNLKREVARTKSSLNGVRPRRGIKLKCPVNSPINTEMMKSGMTTEYFQTKALSWHKGSTHVVDLNGDDSVDEISFRTSDKTLVLISSRRHYFNTPRSLTNPSCSDMAKYDTNRTGVDEYLSVFDRN